MPNPPHTPGEDEEDERLAMAAPSSPYEALTRADGSGAELEHAAAVFLLAYQRVVPGDRPDTGTVAEVLALRAKCRAHPWVWAAIRHGDYVGFARALGVCGLRPAAIPAMQTAVTKITAELRPPPVLEGGRFDARVPQPA
jgi:hypothetical protein